MFCFGCAGFTLGFLAQYTWFIFIGSRLLRSLLTHWATAIGATLTLPILAAVTALPGLAARTGLATAFTERT
jgi:hypothetical protein